MSRLPYAAKQLIEQVQAERPSAKAEPVGDPDGLNVHRTIKFDKRTSKWLAPLAEQFLDTDPRIAEWNVTDAGYLHVDFITTPGADDRSRFLLSEAIMVADSEPEPEVESSESEPED
jgi:hypothetical protein